MASWGPFQKDDNFYKRVISRSIQRFLEDLDPTSILDLFLETEYMTSTQVRDIQELRLTSHKTREILKRVGSKGTEGYKKFKECLTRSKQEHLKKYLDDIELALGREIMARRNQETGFGTSPEDELAYDPITRKQYEAAIKEGTEVDRNIRLMIIGCYEQGKTTLTRRLLDEGLQGIECTNGIDILKAACTEDGKTWKRLKEQDVLYEGLERLARIENVQEKRMTSSHSLLSEEPNASVQAADGSEMSGESENEATGAAKNVEMSTLPLPDDLSEQQKAELMQFQRIIQNNEHEKKQVISLWDFGGQFVFYSTHQLFHSPNAVYLLVFDLSKKLDLEVTDKDYPDGKRPFAKSMKDYIEFWVTSVHSFVGSRDAKRPVIILVGTHADKIKDESEATAYFDAVRDMFRPYKLRYHIYPKCFPIAGTDLNDDTFPSIREEVVMIGKQNERNVPARWIPLEMALRKRENEKILTFEELIGINKVLDHPVGEDQIKAFLRFHHNMGTFIYFDEGEMANHVVVNPPYIVDAFKCIITSAQFCKSDADLSPLWEKLISQAKLEPDLLDAVWRRDQREFIKFKDVLVSILQRHRIIAEAHELNEESQKLTPRGFFIVPSFLRKSKKKEVKAFLDGRNCTTVSLVYKFTHEAIVPTVFQRVTCAAIGSWSVVKTPTGELLFDNAGVYKPNNINYSCVIAHVGCAIEILVAHICPGKDISSEVPDYVRRFVEHVIKNEFQKLADDRDYMDAKPFSTAVRCYHKDHRCEGSKETHDLEMLKRQQDREFCCPDNLAHDGISIDGILREWFNYKISDKVIPQRRLELTEFVELSSAIRDKWELLGALLKIKTIKMQHIKLENEQTSMRIFEMLKEWDRALKEEGNEATLDTLVKALNKLPKGSVDWDIINNLIDKIY